MRISALHDGQGLGGIVFRDRTDAGERLSKALEPLRNEHPLVLGLARGGVVLAAEVAKYLKAPLDTLICQKIGAPHQPEFAIGAVAPGGIRVSDEDLLDRLGITPEEFDEMASPKIEEVNRRTKAYRGDKPPPNLEGRTAIIVDDGLATGATALAAAKYARTLGAAKVVLAVPVCSSTATDLLRGEVDEMICLSEPSVFYAVGQWYQDFAQVEDQEVIDLLRRSENASPEEVAGLGYDGPSDS